MTQIKHDEEPVKVELSWSVRPGPGGRSAQLWIAYRGDMDLGITVGHGTTPLEAVADLFMQED